MNKRVLRNLLVACVLVLSSAQAMAQKPVQSMQDAFARFTEKLVKDRQTTLVNSSSYDEGYIREYHFQTQVATVKKFDETMMDNAASAYSSFMKGEGLEARDRASLSLSYGENNKKSYDISYDRNYSYNVQLLRDPKDKTKRYAYVLVWKKSGDKAEGYALSIYGHDPQVKVSELDDARLIGTPKSSAEFVQAFSNLRTLFVKQNDEMKRDLQFGRNFGRNTSDKLPMLTAVANKMLVLCASYGSLLNNADGQLVRQTLQELQKASGDKYVGDLMRACSSALDIVKSKP